MATIYPPTKNVHASLPVTPHEVNKSLRSTIGEFNGRMDRENFTTNDIQSDKIAYKALNSFEFIGSVAPVSIQQKGQPVGTMYAVPFTVFGTDRMEVKIECVDGALVVEASMTVKSLGVNSEAPTADASLASNAPWSLVITVDGRVAAESGMSAAYPFTCRHIKQLVPVGAGIHTVTMHLRVGSSGRRVLVSGVSANYASVGYSMGPRTLFARNAKR